MENVDSKADLIIDSDFVAAIMALENDHIAILKLAEEKIRVRFGVLCKLFDLDENSAYELTPEMYKVWEGRFPEYIIKHETLEIEKDENHRSQQLELF